MMLYTLLMDMMVYVFSGMTVFRPPLPYIGSLYLDLFEITKFMLIGVVSTWTGYKLKLMVRHRQRKRYPPGRLDLHGNFTRG